MRVTERNKWVVGVVVSGLVAGVANATPSTTYWTPMTMDIQPCRVLHIGVDDYFTVFKKASAGGGSFPTDAGLTIGVLPFERFQMRACRREPHQRDPGGLGRPAVLQCEGGDA